MIGRSFTHFVRYFLGLDAAHTQTTVKERDLLVRLVQNKTCLVELGVYEGFTTGVIARAMRSDALLFAVDPFLSGRLGICWGKWIAHREAYKSAGSKKVVFLQQYSHEAAANFVHQPDFVFIDGDHSLEGIRRDWSGWSSKLSAQG